MPKSFVRMVILQLDGLVDDAEEAYGQYIFSRYLSTVASW